MRAVVGAIAFVLLACLASRAPADWDAVGFVESVTRFDLARFAPHPPGYPVFVLVARAFALVAPDAVRAASWASSLGGALLVGSIAWTLRHRWLALVALALPVTMLLACAPRSDTLGVGLLAAACAASRPWAVGVWLALAVGARPSNLVWVLAVFAVRAATWTWRARAVSLASAAPVCAVWSAWLLAQTGGLARYVALTRTQADGHFRAWGGSAWTEPDERARALLALRRVMVGVGADTWPGVLLLAALVLAAWRGAWSLERSHRRAVVGAALVSLAITWITQNVSGDVRHLLPALCGVTWLAARGMDAFVARDRGRRAVVALVLAVALLRCGARAWTQHAVMPAAVQVADVVRARGDREAVVFGARASRVIAWRGVRTMLAAHLGEVVVTLSRLDRLPRAVYVTDEVLGRAHAPGRFGPPITRCRDARVDGERACVTLFPYDVLGR